MLCAILFLGFATSNISDDWAICKCKIAKYILILSIYGVWMINYLSEEEIKELNKYSLQATDEENEFYIMQPNDIRFLINFVKRNLRMTYYKRH